MADGVAAFDGEPIGAKDDDVTDDSASARNAWKAPVVHEFHVAGANPGDRGQGLTAITHPRQRAGIS